MGTRGGGGVISGGGGGLIIIGCIFITGADQGAYKYKWQFTVFFIQVWPDRCELYWR